MLKVLEYIKDFFVFIIELVKSFGSLIVAFVTVLGKCVAFLGRIIGALPPLFTISLGVLVVVCVLYKVLGREAQS